MSRGSNDTDDSPETTISQCAVCGALLTVGTSYIIRIDIFADPAWSDSGLAGDKAANQETLTQLINEIKSMSADALQDGVHRRFEYRICARCQPRLLANPLGLPRISREAAN